MAPIRRIRQVQSPPRIRCFKPAGIPARELVTRTLSVDEFEAIRLADEQGLDHAEAAEAMGISRPTFSRLVERARHALACALVHGEALQIEGGDVHYCRTRQRCLQCGHEEEAPAGKPRKRCRRCQSTRQQDLAQESQE